MTGEVGPRLTDVCHCVLLWVFVFDIGQGGKDEPGMEQKHRISIALQYHPSELKKQAKHQHPHP